MTFTKVEGVAWRIIMILSLIASLTLTVAYLGQVKHLRHSLNAACQERLVQHNATHKAVGASLQYERTQLALLEANYSNQLKIIASYPPKTQPAAVRRVNENRASLENVVAKYTAAYEVQNNFTCAH